MFDGLLTLLLILLIRSILNSTDPSLVPARLILAVVLVLALLSRI